MKEYNYQEDKLTDIIHKRDEMIWILAKQLAALESCPNQITDQGCPRPNERKDAYDKSPESCCSKSWRRDEFGANCWAMWAADLAGAYVYSATVDNLTK